MFLNALAGDRFHAESAGLEPRELNPLVIEVMREIGFDLSAKRAQSLFEFYKEGRIYDYVIAVCEKEVEEKCPIFPGVSKKLHWPFPDPSLLQGTHEEQLKQTRKIRDDIKSRIETWIKEFS